MRTPDSREKVPALQRFPPERSDDRGRFPCIDRGNTSGCGSFDRRPSPCSLPSRSCLSARCFHRVAALNLRALLRVRVRCRPHRFRCRGPILPWAWLDWLVLAVGFHRTRVRCTSGTSRSCFRASVRSHHPASAGVSDRRIARSVPSLRVRAKVDFRRNGWEAIFPSNWEEVVAVFSTQLPAAQFTGSSLPLSPEGAGTQILLPQPPSGPFALMGGVRRPFAESPSCPSPQARTKMPPIRARYERRCSSFSRR